jgi:hypothetical protein
MSAREAALDGTGWHLSEPDLRRYAQRGLDAAVLWSAEAHLAACPYCRERLDAVVAPELLRDGWARLDAELDEPVPGPAERLLVRLGVAGHTARLLAATPVLRLSWLSAVAVTLGLAALLANLAHPVVFLAAAPLLPVAGVALAFGPRADPTYEMALVAPMHTAKLLLLRCAAVLSVTTGLSAVACLALPDFGPVALGWFLPALALTLLSLALTPQLGPILAAASVGAGWLALVTATARPGGGGSLVFVPLGQLGLALAGALAGITLVRLRRAFETPRRIR